MPQRIIQPSPVALQLTERDIITTAITAAATSMASVPVVTNENLLDRAEAFYRWMKLKMKPE